MAGDLSVGERCLPAGAAAGAEKIPTSLTRSFQDVRCNNNQLSGNIWHNQHLVQMSVRSKSLIIMAMMPAEGRRRWDNVQRIEHHLTEVALERQRGSRNFPPSRAFYNILVKSILPEKYLLPFHIHDNQSLLSQRRASEML